MGKRAKEIVLFALAVTALITAVFTFRGAPAPAPASHGGPPVPVPSAAHATRAPAAQVSAAHAVTLTKASNRNPFAAPPGAPQPARAKPTPTEPSAPPAQPRPAVAAVAPAAVSAAPPLPVAAATPGAAGPLPVVAPPGAAPPAPTVPTLSGVVVDSSGHPTAVIREGDQRHFARAGDQIAGKYRVQSISDRQVVLTGTQGKLILKMGGNR